MSERAETSSSMASENSSGARSKTAAFREDRCERGAQVKHVKKTKPRPSRGTGASAAPASAGTEGKIGCVPTV